MNNVAPAEFYVGRHYTVLPRREKINWVASLVACRTWEPGKLRAGDRRRPRYRSD